MNTFLRWALLCLAVGLSSSVWASEKLNIYVWSESIDPALIAKFERETGIDVRLDSYTSNEDLVAKLMSGVSAYDRTYSDVKREVRLTITKQW